MSLEALWTLYFGDYNQPQELTPGMSNAGVVVLETGRIFGGDVQFYYTGHFHNDQGKITADVEAKHFNGPGTTAFGTNEKRFRVRLEGTWTNETEIHAEMYKPEAPENRLPVFLIYREALPNP
jgi:hypothetical protein